MHRHRPVKTSLGIGRNRLPATPPRSAVKAAMRATLAAESGVWLMVSAGLDAWAKRKGPGLVDENGRVVCVCVGGGGG